MCKKAIISLLTLAIILTIALAGCEVEPETTTVTTTTTAVSTTQVTKTTTIYSTVIPPSSEGFFEQTISWTDEPTSCTNTDYVKYLYAGEKVTGVVQLLGESTENDSFIFTVLYRGGEDGVKSIYMNWSSEYVGDNKHAFGFTVEEEGEYILRISVSTDTTRTILLEISPAGWR